MIRLRRIEGYFPRSHDAPLFWKSRNYIRLRVERAAIVVWWDRW